jgi:hypothetical protein
LTPGIGVTFNIPTGYTAATGRKGSVVAAMYVGGDVWDITGDVSA